jgi:hypothetical protein
VGGNVSPGGDAAGSAVITNPEEAASVEQLLTIVNSTLSRAVGVRVLFARIHKNPLRGGVACTGMLGRGVQCFTCTTCTCVCKCGCFR